MAFVGFLAGVCLIATGLTFLETIANPYTTVLGDPRFAATRINLAQSCNGLGWIFGPPLGGIFFYSKDAAGRSTGSQTLYIPYVALAIGALLIAVVFWFANVPDIKMKDEYHLDDVAAGGCAVHLVASAFRAGGGGAVLLRGGAGGDLQLLHQLHDGGSARDPGRRGPAGQPGARGSRRTRPGCSRSATRARRIWRRWRSGASCWGASAGRGC